MTKEINIIANEKYRKLTGIALNSWNVHKITRKSKITLGSHEYDAKLEGNSSWFVIDKVEENTIYFKEFKDFERINQ